MLILDLVDKKSREPIVDKKTSEPKPKPVTRCRISEMTMRRLFSRKLIGADFLMEVQNWLFQAGWVLFFAGDSYALVKLGVVNGWMRIGSKRVKPTLSEVARGTFNFQALERLLVEDGDIDSEADSEEE